MGSPSKGSTLFAGVDPEFRRRVVEPLLAGPLAGLKLVGTEPRPADEGLVLELEGGGGRSRVVVRRRAEGGASLARSEDWELVVQGPDSCRRDPEALAAVLVAADGVGLSPLVEPELLAQFVPRIDRRGPPAEAAELLARHRPPWPARLVLWAKGDADRSRWIGGKVLAWMCQSYAREERAAVRLVDVGAGFGALVDLLRAAGFRRACGVDHTPRRALPARLSGIPVHWWDGRRLRERPELRSLDVVTFVRVFDADDVGPELARELVREAVGALAPGGTMLVGAPGDLRHDELRELGLQRVSWPNPPGWGQHLHVFRRHESDPRESSELSTN